MAIVLENLQLSAFKGFREFSVPLAPFTCLVGLNSKGKTTVLQAIRLLHDMFVFAFGAKDQPDFSNVRWQANPSQSLAKFSFDDPAAVWLHRKTTEPCRIGLAASGGLAVLLEIKGPSQYDLDVQLNGQSVKSSMSDSAIQQVLSDFFLLNPIFVPPVGPVTPSEQLLPFPEMQQRSEQGRLSECWRSYLHWLYNDGMRREFDSVIALIQRYLPETVLQPPSLTHDSPPKVLVQFKEDSTTLDISHSGSGMRTLLNLAVVLKFAQTGCLLFDEPDSHLHGQLQRSVARMLVDFSDEHGTQVIIASHAPDLISEMPVESLVWIDRSTTKAHRRNELGQLLADLGAATSTDAVRSYGADKILFVEGPLDRIALAQLIGPLCSPNPFEDTSVLVATLPDGKGDSLYLEMFRKMLYESLKITARVAALVDNDFDLPGSPEDSSEKGSGKTAALRLTRKEVENFFLDPTVFANATRMAAAERASHMGHEEPFPDEAAIRTALNDILSQPDVRNAVRYQVIPRLQKTLPKELDDSTKLQRAENWFDEHWSREDWRINNCPGKKVLKSLRRWVQSNYKLTVPQAKLREACQEPATELRQTASWLTKQLYGQNVEET